MMDDDQPKRPPAGLDRASSRYINRHLRGTPQMQRELSRTGSAHVFVTVNIMQTLEQRQADEWTFIEVWTDATSKVPYLLLLVADQDGFKIYDPKESYKEVFSASTYEEAKLWLVEDEYELVDGRLTED